MTIKPNYIISQIPSVADFNTFAANPALQYITTVNLNAVTTNISSVFSSTYDNYRFEFSKIYSTSGFVTFPMMTFTSGAGTAHFDGVKSTSAAGANSFNGQNGSPYWLCGYCNTTQLDAGQISMDIYNPFQTYTTSYTSKFSNSNGGGFGGGIVNTTTSYTGCQIVGLFGSNIVGTLRVYGYRKS